MPSAMATAPPQSSAAGRLAEIPMLSRKHEAGARYEPHDDAPSTLTEKPATMSQMLPTSIARLPSETASECRRSMVTAGCVCSGDLPRAFGAPTMQVISLQTTRTSHAASAAPLPLKSASAWQRALILGAQGPPILKVLRLGSARSRRRCGSSLQSLG